MPVLRLQNFGGTIPMLGDRALPDGFAVDSVNTWFYGNEMRGIRIEKTLTTVTDNTLKVFRLPRLQNGGNPMYPGVPPPSYVGDDKWVLLPHKDTDIVGGATVNDQWDRWYFCDPLNGAYWNTYARMLHDPTQGFYKLGIPGPSNLAFGYGYSYNPVVGTPTGGTAPPTGIEETRAYVYTWVNEYEEESAPSFSDEGNGHSDATWPITNILDPPALPAPVDPVGASIIGTPGYPAWKGKYLYRTVVSGSGIVNYYRVPVNLVPDHPNLIPLGTTTINDANLTSTIVAGNTLESTSWQPAPPLDGIVGMPNGFLIGFKGKDIFTSESYRFHAWPPEFRYTNEYKIVGLGQIDTTCVVCTEGYPSSISGMKPGTLAFNKANTNEPCLSRGSIVSTPNGVIYSSPNGLMSLGPGGFINATEKIITRTKWQQDFSPAHIRGVRFQQGYLALKDVPEPNALDEEHELFYLDQTDLRVALTRMQNFATTRNIQSDVFSSEVFLLSDTDTNTVIKQWDPALDGDKWKPTLWRSKEFQFQYKENFSCYSVYWDQDRFWGSTDCAELIPADVAVIFKVYADRLLVYDEPVPVNGQPVRLPSGYKSDIWQFEIIARAPIYSVHVASTVKELKGV